MGGRFTRGVINKTATDNKSNTHIDTTHSHTSYTARPRIYAFLWIEEGQEEEVEFGAVDQEHVQEGFGVGRGRAEKRERNDDKRGRGGERD